MSVDFFYNFLAGLGYTHPVHPIAVHVTIGLVVAALVFALLALSPRYEKYAVTARHCVTLGFIMVFPTILLGFMDWLYYYGGGWTTTFKIKVTFGLILAVLLGIAALLPAKLTYRSPAVLASYLASFLVVVVLGYYGGELVHGSASPPAEEEEEDDPDGRVSYAQIDRIMRDACVSCHAPGNDIWDLDLTTYEALMEGSKNGPIVVPGEPGESELVKRIDGTTEPQMPLGGSLSQRDKDRIIRWVEQGAEKD
ncbi:c-type cytochrome domain-containing protein [Halorhodospira halophila]|uniref:Cytochrome c domain-containing protein n=1 Tax=Halorhodospira halophila (strain DSM 244 / SL1) TaxID=349124 RepID=A1WTC3_HALHL|nr:c-type cytochrome domain-containing protein [Halorhodospira halophila]ABM60935.1 hypothetical protein Hhal_0141 [Halorhodospira halophila SL1]MBK1728593.1 hypothetical protein [Halorhodospira halophila]